MNHDFFMKAALKEAQKALSCNEFPVGCVLVSDNRIIATGSRTGTTGNSTNETDHAEMVVLRHLNELKDAPDYRGMTLYTTMEPCLMCFGAILIYGIGSIVYAYEDVMGGGTGCQVDNLPHLYKTSSIRIVSNVLRKESLELFKQFFSNPENEYWKGSLLARYTLEQ